MNRIMFCAIGFVWALGAMLWGQDAPFTPDKGFTALFDGKTLAGWIGSLDGYAVENGNLVCVAGGKGNLLTEKKYANFILRFEFKLTPGANNGLGIRCPQVAEGNLHLDGIELQILDDSAEKYRELKPYQYHGSVYGIVPAKRGSLKPVGEWNRQEVTVQGRRIKIVVNDVVIVDADLDEATKNGTMDGQAHPGLERMTGQIGLLGHGDRVDFRHLQIKELPLTHTTDALDAVKQRLNDNSAILLDVRELSEWNEGHVKGAISLPVSSLSNDTDSEQHVKKLPKDKVIYTHCFAGGRAVVAAEELSKRGFDVRPLKHGIRELWNAGFPQED